MIKRKSIFIFLLTVLVSFVIYGNTAKGGKEMNVKVTAGSHTFIVKLENNVASHALYDKLPLTLPMANRYGREMVYRFGAGGLPTDNASDQGYKVGDLSYWPPMGSLVILYKQNGEVFEQQKLGHTDADISFFNEMKDTNITFEKQE
ncbi:cyclophilin-like fold protein [Fusobacterium simiae]|uniref:Cyclophilin-like fold protein n=1 Tax=Fusobacterium simiae TaxID=855 RepID=A0ABT4DNK7_FUSSI|nr:cyclophilin-like fold protein [Fusobacterium simiae]MCY7008956.1 cyclophilin-like fold protein [Fusobacterium simiae]